MSVHESILFDFIVAECNSIDPAIHTNISDDGHTLVISNISEEAMIKLVFPINKDSNNNKLTLVYVNVSLVSNPTLRVNVPGLTQQLIHAFNNSNSKAYKNAGIIHAPFAEIPSGIIPQEQPTLTASQLTDLLTSVTTFTKSTYKKEKLFGLILTNQCTDSGGKACKNQGNLCKINDSCPDGYLEGSGECCKKNYVFP
jgi:hypothetical protein